MIDFEAILIDGAFPKDVKETLASRTRRYLANQDTRGLIAPEVVAGDMGGKAREIGAACSPIFSQYFLNTNTGLSDAD